VADAELVRAAGRYRQGAGVGLAYLLPSEAPGHVDFTASLESAVTLICDGTKPEPALRFDTGRWVGQGAVLIHEGPEVFPDVGLGVVVFHDNDYGSSLIICQATAFDGGEYRSPQAARGLTRFPRPAAFKLSCSPFPTALMDFGLALGPADLVSIKLLSCARFFSRRITTNGLIGTR
jgi:hypothetical protein